MLTEIFLLVVATKYSQCYVYMGGRLEPPRRPLSRGYYDFMRGTTSVASIAGGTGYHCLGPEAKDKCLGMCNLLGMKLTTESFPTYFLNPSSYDYVDRRVNYFSYLAGIRFPKHELHYEMDAVYYKIIGVCVPTDCKCIGDPGFIKKKKRKDVLDHMLK